MEEKRYDKVKYGVCIYQLKELYSIDYILENIDYAVSHMDEDSMVLGAVTDDVKQGDYIRVAHCPSCGKMYSGYPAISRKDNTTEICSDCGVHEAFEDFKKGKVEK